MSSLVVLGPDRRPLFRLTWARALTAAALLLPMAGAVLALARAAPGTLLWPAIVLAAAVAWTATFPDGLGGLVTLLGFGGWWAVVVADPLTPWVLPAALCCVGFHAVVAQAAVGPWGIRIPAAVLRRGLRDLLGVAAITVGIGSLAISAAGSFEAPMLLIVGTLGLIATLAWLGPRGDSGDRPGDRPGEAA
ncbi:hypothetical protein [Nocardioides limicola]|uniref:hypothetical protein n=1 Tax=Nocardioides limicola TaxID=2803368 RepID=UPI00193C6B82|nr:hypothetical protein [Nocardioides sp. DJM-14]